MAYFTWNYARSCVWVRVHVCMCKVCTCTCIHVRLCVLVCVQLDSPRIVARPRLGVDVDNLAVAFVLEEKAGLVVGNHLESQMGVTTLRPVRLAEGRNKRSPARMRNAEA